MTPKILVIGTFDTKEPELGFLLEKITEAGGEAISMDVSVLGDTSLPIQISKEDVAKAAGKSIKDVQTAADENHAMQIMATGASLEAARLVANGGVQAMIALGGTMGTDLALDVANALPLGVPKIIVSTVAFSPLLPTDRIPPDAQMVLWAGGLYGLNALCKSTLSQAAGAAVGAARSATGLNFDKPLIGMTSLGSSALTYMKKLLPPLQERGFDVAVFHSTGMGGRAFETLAAAGKFCCVMDFCGQELANAVHGSLVTAGDDRMLSAGRNGTPQMLAAGCSDFVDVPEWSDHGDKWKDHPYHAHNRLIGSYVLTSEERDKVAKEFATRAASATSPTQVFITEGGIVEWDREGEPGYNPEGLASFNNTLKNSDFGEASVETLSCHIGDQEFADKVIEKFDQWVEQGIVKP